MSAITVGSALAAGAALGALVVRPVVVAYARPRPDGPSRACPRCGEQALTASVDGLAQVVRGRCRACGERLGPALGVAEVVVALAFAVIVAAGGEGWLLAAQLWTALVGSALALVDASVRRLPDHLTAAAAMGLALLLGGATLAGQPAPTAIRMVEAAAVVGILSFVVMLFGGFAMGDAKILPTLGALLAWNTWGTVLLGVFVGFLLAAVQGSALLISRRARIGERARLALGPALIIGAVLTSVVI